jgi:hypothetical protein
VPCFSGCSHMKSAVSLFRHFRQGVIPAAGRFAGGVSRYSSAGAIRCIAPLSARPSICRYRPARVR